MRFSIWLAIVVAALLGLASPSYAQATRTWVSGVGDDANPCSRTAPCKTFAGAISKTAASGEINTLDPGGFGAVTITKAITIRSDSIEAGVLVSGSNGIIVAAGAADRVVLEGLDFEGLGPAASNTSLNGVKVVSGAAVYVIRCAIRGFTSANGTDGNGVLVNSSTVGTRVFIKDSFIENNVGGVNVNGNGTGNSVSISNTLIDGNTSFAVKVGATGNAAAIVRSILSGSPAALSIGAGGAVISFGPSNIIAGTGLPTTTTPYQ